MPDLPTVREFVPGYEAIGWYGVGAPKSTPAEIIDKLNNEINAVLANPTSKARASSKCGLAHSPSPPIRFSSAGINNSSRWRRAIQYRRSTSGASLLRSANGLEIGGFAGHIQRMTQRRLLTLSWVLLLVLTVSGCTSCGWIWQDWLDSPQKACRDRVPEQK
jgi:Tripartite tricarboxylate transporter family receptor